MVDIFYLPRPRSQGQQQSITKLFPILPSKYYQISLFWHKIWFGHKNSTLPLFFAFLTIVCWWWSWIYMNMWTIYKTVHGPSFLDKFWTVWIDYIINWRSNYYKIVSPVPIKDTQSHALLKSGYIWIKDAQYAETYWKKTISDFYFLRYDRFCNQNS